MTKPDTVLDIDWMHRDGTQIHGTVEMRHCYNKDEDLAPTFYSFCERLPSVLIQHDMDDGDEALAGTIRVRLTATETHICATLKIQHSYNRNEDLMPTFRSFCKTLSTLLIKQDDKRRRVVKT